MVEPIGKAYKPWLIASVAVLVGSLILLAGTVAAGFITYTDKAMPIWVVVMGVAAAVGIGIGFGGFFLMMLTAGWKSFREGRRVQVISPKHEG